MCFPAERRKVDKDARACTVKDAYALVLGTGNGLTVEMLRRTAPRIMPRRLIVVAEARLQAQIHKQAEQNKVRRRLLRPEPPPSFPLSCTRPLFVYLQQVRGTVPTASVRHADVQFVGVFRLIAGDQS